MKIRWVCVLVCVTHAHVRRFTWTCTRILSEPTPRSVTQIYSGLNLLLAVTDLKMIVIHAYEWISVTHFCTAESSRLQGCLYMCLFLNTLERRSKVYPVDCKITGSVTREGSWLRLLRVRSLVPARSCSEWLRKPVARWVHLWCCCDLCRAQFNDFRV